MKTKSPSTFSIHALYVLAGVTLFGAVLLLISALGFQSSLGMSLNVFTAAFGPISEVFVGMLMNAIQGLGILFAGMMFVVAILLCMAGRMARRAQDLSQRVVSLETRLATLEEETK